LILSNIKTKLRQQLAKWLIRFKKLTHVDYSPDEISQLITPHRPVTFPVTVPRGDGKFHLSSIAISVPADSKFIKGVLSGGLEVTYLGSPIYRAHIVISVQAKPDYLAETASVKLKELSITEIYMVNDEYSILKDTSSLISLFVPSPVLSMMTGTMKTAFNLMTGSTASEANAYLQVYLSGSKQKVLDYHRPQLEKIIVELAAGEDMCYTLNKTDWEENLFIKYGQEVVVEQGNVRFKF
jgi:hypothetical protein